MRADTQTLVSLSRGREKTVSRESYLRRNLFIRTYEGFRPSPIYFGESTKSRLSEPVKIDLGSDMGFSPSMTEVSVCLGEVIGGAI